MGKDFDLICTEPFSKIDDDTNAQLGSIYKTWSEEGPSIYMIKVKL